MQTNARALDEAARRANPNRPTFAEFLAACAPGYLPSLRADLIGPRRAKTLAAAFDAAREAEGRPERAVIFAGRRA